jgi:hypothetical protein
VIFSSLVTSRALCVKLLATIRRSAGSP